MPARAAEARRVVVEHYYPLFTAADNGREGIVEVLLGMEGVDVNRGSLRDGTTPLIMACQDGHEGVVRLLLAHAATDVNQATTDDGTTPLIRACDKGHEGVVRLLVEEANAEVNKVNGKNQTPINIAAYAGHLGVVRFLLSKGADCTIKDQWGNTPLALARAKGHAEVAALLE